MATTGRTAATTEHDAGSVLTDADFVRVRAAPTGGSLAAAAILAAAAEDRDVPFQVRVGHSAPESTAATLAIGVDAPDAATSIERDAANTAFGVARDLGASPSPVLAFAGALADCCEPSSDVRAAADLERRPGVGVPTADRAAGLAHSTLVHAPFSGDEQAAGATLAELDLPPDLDDAARRRLASVVALDVTEDAPASAADAVQGALRPHVTPDGPFETAEGYADVLSALAVDAPGLGVALALGAGDDTAALDAWKAHAVEAHRAVRDADLARHSGFAVAEADAAVPTVARLLRDYRSEEPAVLVVGDDVAALATTDDDARTILSDSAGTASLAITDSTTTDDLVETVRGER
jgi:hypothetical protein